ncbi:MAG: hypothetical protein ACK55I_03975, partial [bacterium]
QLNVPWAIVENSLLIAQEKLCLFSIDADFEHKIRLTFGDDADLAAAISLIQELAQSNSSLLPTIEILPESEINGAKGAFSGSNYTIYLSQEFLQQNHNDSEAVVNVVLEELGHSIDWKLHTDLDTLGDEGELF